MTLGLTFMTLNVLIIPIIQDTYHITNDGISTFETILAVLNTFGSLSFSYICLKIARMKLLLITSTIIITLNIMTILTPNYLYLVIVRSI